VVQVSDRLAFYVDGLFGFLELVLAAVNATLALLGLFGEGGVGGGDIELLLLLLLGVFYGSLCGQGCLDIGV
jgi:hypothetical protein